MNQITEAAEQMYPIREQDTIYQRGDAKIRQHECVQNVTHYLAFMKERGYEMCKVEVNVKDVLNPLVTDWYTTGIDITDILIKALAIGEARGRDKWIRVEEMTKDQYGIVCWLSNGHLVGEGYTYGNHFKGTNAFPITAYTPTYFMPIKRPSPPKTQQK